MDAPRSYPWQLPDGIDELLPERAAHVEALRRRLLDAASRWGYELVMPPLAEFTDSLHTGVGEDLDLLTFKVPDQLSGRTLGIRADITPQVARMDAHSLGDRQINRLCYAGSTLHTRARSLLASRSPLQLGAELFGVAGLEGDVEVIDLMLTLLRRAGLPPEQRLTLDLGHSSVFAQVLAACETANSELDAALFDAVQRKSRPDLDVLLDELPAQARPLFEALLELHGGVAVIDAAEERLLAAVPALAGPLADLRHLAEVLGARYPELGIYIDLGELRGYRYHTGVVFAAYSEDVGEALARGGRYDNVGAAHGRARPATGFAMDLRVLASQVTAEAAAVDAIAAPAASDPELQARIAALREAGETVVLSAGGAVDPRCRRELAAVEGEWTLRAIASSEQNGHNGQSDQNGND